MTLVPDSVAVPAGVATKLAANPRGGGVDSDTVGVLLKNTTGSATIWVGAANVTGSAGAHPGFPWEPDDGPFPMDLEPGEECWGFVDVGAAAQAVHTLMSGR